MTETAFQGECMLVGWSESSSRGKTCTLRFHDLENDSNPLKLYRPGARFAVVMVAIGDDEQPSTPKKVEPKASNLAALLCKDSNFYYWAGWKLWAEVDNEQEAKEYLCNTLCIKSRAELDTNDVARKSFMDDFYTPFQEWASTALKVKK